MTMLSSDNGKKPSILKRIFADNNYCWIAALCTVGVMMLVYFCYDLFPFGGQTILRMDLYHQYGPLFAELYDRVTHLESLIYSWRTGLGGPFLGNFFNYLSSPSGILILLLGHENMPEAIAGMIISKAALSAASFTYYLKKSQGKHDFSTAAFGVLYSMCGYFIAYYWNVMWIDAMVYFPLVMLGIENIINRKGSKVYIAFLALTLISNYYMGYMTCVFSVLYFIAYYFREHDITTVNDGVPCVINENGKKKYSLKNRILGSSLLGSGINFVLSSIAAAGIVAFALLPTYLILKNCSATSGTMPSLDQYTSYFSIFDFLANHLASVNPTIRSSGEDVLPNVYCGMAALILVPLYLFVKSIPLREKITYTGLLGILYLSFNINILNYIWHGFHYPNDLPYRFSFMYCFILLTMAYKALTRIKEFTGRQILGAGMAVIGAIILIQELGSKNVEDITVVISIVFTVTYCLVLYLMKDEKFDKRAVSVLLLCCIVGELACANTDRYSMDQPKENFVGDYDEFRILKEDLDKLEGTDKYRMELTYNRARMDPSWFGFNGISTFSSMAYEKMSNVQSNLGLYGNYINSYTYKLQTPVYNMMHSLKYIVDNDTEVEVTNDYYKMISGSGKFIAYENNYYLPIGMAVNKSLSEWYTGYTNPFTVQSDWFEYSTGVSDVFGMMEINEIRYYNVDEITSGLDTGDLYFNKPTSETGELTFVLKVPETKHCYLFADSTAFDHITINKNGESKTQNTDEPYIYDLGIVTPEDDLTVFISIEDAAYGYINLYPYYVNDDALNEGYRILSESAMKVEKFGDTDIKGTVSVKEDGFFFSSIPYDKSWQVIVDGEKLSDDQVIALEDAFLCFNISAGEHTVEFRYRQKGLLIGAAVSVFTVLALIAVGFFLKKKKEEKEEAARKAEEERLRLEAMDEEAIEIDYFGFYDDFGPITEDNSLSDLSEEAPAESKVEAQPEEAPDTAPEETTEPDNSAEQTENEDPGTENEEL